MRNLEVRRPSGWNSWLHIPAGCAMYAVQFPPMIANQLDLSLPVAVCAWCKPKERGNGIGHLSHGICPGHLRKIKLELQGFIYKRRRRNRPDSSEALLPL